LGVVAEERFEVVHGEWLGFDELRRKVGGIPGVGLTWHGRVIQ
jgi:hypothetical protein